jgi:hypothetical protein
MIPQAGLHQYTTYLLQQSITLNIPQLQQQQPPRIGDRCLMQDALQA